MGTLLLLDDPISFLVKYNNWWSTTCAGARMSLLAVTSCCPLDGALAGGQALSLYIFKSQLWGKSPPSQAHQDMHEDYLHMHGFFCQSLLAKHGHGYPRCSCSMISQQEEQKRQCTMCTAHPPNRQASLSDTIGLYDG